MATNSETSLCNTALVSLKANTLLNLTTDTSEEATICQVIYYQARNQLLVVYPWGFATKRATLQQNVVAPDWGYTYAYPLPSDYLKIQLIADEDINRFEVEEKQIVTDASTCKIKYTAEITDVGAFDEKFVFLLPYLIKAMMAYAITGKRTIEVSAWQLYQEMEIDAFNSDSSENSIIETTENDLIVVR